MEQNVLVTIGIPIYYGEIYLEETLQNILGQSFQDFEIILADNNPGGKVEEIAVEYSKNHKNIRYIRHEKNIGALANWNSLITHATGKFFIYAGGHDLWSDFFLERLVQKMENSPDAVLAYAPSFWMEDKPEDSTRSTGFFDTTGHSFIQRFNAVFWGPEESLYGLIRTDAIAKTRLQAQIIGSGAVWLTELSLSGHFMVVPDICRYRRKNREEEDRHKRLKRYYKTLFKREKIYWLPYWKFFFYYLSVPFTGKTGFGNRLKIFFSILGGFLVRYLPDMLLDIVYVFRRIFKKY